MKFFLENVKSIREHWRYKSQDDFGKLFGFKTNFINNIENGKTKPKLDFLFKLEEMTGFTTRELCTEKINILNLPDRPFKNGEGLEKIKSSHININNGNGVVTQNIGIDEARIETIAAQAETIILLKKRIAELESR